MIKLCTTEISLIYPLIYKFQRKNHIEIENSDDSQTEIISEGSIYEDSDLSDDSDDNDEKELKAYKDSI